MCIKNNSGQLLLPILALIMLFGVFLAGYLRWCSKQYWDMRMSIAAEMTALSVARAEAQDLNKISFNNLTLNGLFVKGTVPDINAAVGLTTVAKYPKIQQQADAIEQDVEGFKKFCLGVGAVVSKLNGADPLTNLNEPTIDSYLLPQRLFLGIIIVPPPFLMIKIVDHAFYTRNWAPNFREAQPTHHTTWIVHAHGSCGTATAAVWLDARLGTGANGGFPRTTDTMIGNLEIQDLYPQFNARLVPTQHWFPCN